MAHTSFKARNMTWCKVGDALLKVTGLVYIGAKVSINCLAKFWSVVCTIR